MTDSVGQQVQAFVNATIGRAAAGMPIPVSRSFRYGGLTLDIHCVDPSADEGASIFFDALIPSPTGTEAADLTILVSGSRADVLGAPPVDWHFGYDRADTRRHTYWGGSATVAVAAEILRGIWSLADLRGGIGVQWINDPAVLPWWEFTTPFRHHLHWAALTHGHVLAHAAAVNFDGRGALLVGEGGTGKSTTSLACLTQGAGLVAEDLCWIERNECETIARATYNTMKLTEDATRRFDFARQFLASRPSRRFEKNVVFLPSEGMCMSVPIRAIYLFTGAFAETTLVSSCQKSAAFRRLASSTIELCPTGAREIFSRLGALVDSQPVFHVTLGSDPLAAANAIRQHLEALQ